MIAAQPCYILKLTTQTVSRVRNALHLPPDKRMFSFEMCSLPQYISDKTQLCFKYSICWHNTATSSYISK